MKTSVQNKYILAFLFLMLSMYITRAQDEDQTIIGPVVGTEFEDSITVQDIGTGNIHVIDQISTQSILSLIYRWTPSGCNLVIRQFDENDRWLYSRLSLSDWTIDALPSVGVPIWSPDGREIAFVDRSLDLDTTNIYISDSLEDNPVLSLSVDGIIGHIDWSSNDSIMYTLDGLTYLWNRTSEAIEAIDVEPPAIDRQRFYSYIISPDDHYLARYADPLEYWAVIDNPEIELSQEEMDMARSEWQSTIPGVEILDLQAENNAPVFVDVNDQYVIQTEWSPSSNRIGLVTNFQAEDFGIFVYDIGTDTLNRLGDAYIEVAQWFYPTWSPDSNWLAFRSPDGYVVHNTTNGEEIVLSDQFQGSQLHWSPVMDYSNQECD